MHGFTTTFNGIGFDQALEQTIQAPKPKGIGVPSVIDVQTAMKRKPT